MSTATESPPTAPAETGMTIASPPGSLTDYSNVNMYDRIQDVTAFISGFGAAIHNSHMFGTLAVAQGQVIAAILVSERKGPHWFLQSFYLVDGKITMRADRMLGNFVQAGGKYKVLQRTSDVAEIEVHHNGNKCKFAFTFNEAQEEPFCRDKKGGIKTNYATPRARSQMLWARVVSDAIRTVAPEIVAGCYVPEDLGLMADDGDADTPKPAEEAIHSPPVATAPAKTAATSAAPFIGVTAPVAAPAAPAVPDTPPSDIAAKKAALPADFPDRAWILQLDVIAEYKFIGLQITDRPASNEGWRECISASGSGGMALVNEISGSYYDRDQKKQFYFAEFLFAHFRYATPQIASKYLAERAAGVKTSPPPLRDPHGGLIDVTKPATTAAPELPKEPMIEAKEEANQLGRKAFANAQFQEANPYAAGGALRECWNYGWHTAKQENDERLAKLAPTETPSAAKEPAPFDVGEVKLVAPDQLNEMRDLKTKLAIPEENWKGKILPKYGVATAKALTWDQAETLLKNMRVKLEGQQKSAELSAWANGATVPANPN